MKRKPRNKFTDKLVNSRLIAMTYGQIGFIQPGLEIQYSPSNCVTVSTEKWCSMAVCWCDLRICRYHRWFSSSSRRVLSGATADCITIQTQKSDAVWRWIAANWEFAVFTVLSVKVLFGSDHQTASRFQLKKWCSLAVGWCNFKIFRLIL